MGQHEMPLWIHLSPHAAESRINVLVMRLEPVAERTAKHTGGGTSAAAFHYVMLPIEEISGISWIELERLKTGEGCKRSRGPFPSVPDQITDTEGALSLRKSSDRRGIPSIEIKISEPVVRSFLAPGKRPLWFICHRRAISSAMPLRFCGQRLPCPARVGAGFGVTHVDRPVERQWNILKHRPVLPLAVDLIPKYRVRNILLGLPLPVGIAPQ